MLCVVTPVRGLRLGKQRLVENVEHGEAFGADADYWLARWRSFTADTRATQFVRNETRQRCSMRGLHGAAFQVKAECERFSLTAGDYK